MRLLALFVAVAAATDSLLMQSADEHLMRMNPGDLLRHVRTIVSKTMGIPERRVQMSHPTTSFLQVRLPNVVAWEIRIAPEIGSWATMPKGYFPLPMEFSSPEEITNAVAGQMQKEASPLNQMLPLTTVRPYGHNFHDTQPSAVQVGGQWAETVKAARAAAGGPSNEMTVEEKAEKALEEAKATKEIILRLDEKLSRAASEHLDALTYHSGPGCDCAMRKNNLLYPGPPYAGYAGAGIKHPPLPAVQYSTPFPCACADENVLPEFQPHTMVTTGGPLFAGQVLSGVKWVDPTGAPQPYRPPAGFPDVVG